MVFTSFNFFIFFPLLVFLYWNTPNKFRWIILLIASYFFYISIKPVFILLVAGVTFTTWIFTCLMEKTSAEQKKKGLLIVNIILILLPLFFFKYFGSINKALIEFFESIHVRWPLPDIKFLLPIGISYYTFMAVGYCIDVYNEKIAAEKNLGIVALFISFFPLILSGPIERANNIIPQLKAQKRVDYDSMVQGLKFMLWGYFLKLVVADRLGIYVDTVFNNMEQHTGTTLLLGLFLYPIQIYGDLGGYSLIAIGCAKCLNIDVMQNFNRPFFAVSMAEFWRRWHISLIKWLTDYIYTPIAFKLRKYKIWGIVIALIITFILSGIWHGVALGFIVWGLIQGFLLSIEGLTKTKKDSFEKKYDLKNKWWYIFICCFITYLLFSFSLVFSKMTDLSQASYFFKMLISDLDHLPYKDGYTMLYGFIAVSVLFIIEFAEEFLPNRFQLFHNKRMSVRWVSYYIVIFMIFYMGVFRGGQFIYYQF